MYIQRTPLKLRYKSYLEYGVLVTSLKHLVLERGGFKAEVITSGTMPPGGLHKTKAVLPSKRFTVKIAPQINFFRWSCLEEKMNT